MNGKDTEEINEFLAVRTGLPFCGYKPGLSRTCCRHQHFTLLTQQSIKDGCEGLMIKTLEQNASYEPSKRSLNWLKVRVSK